jgi:prepilin-type processing-associated H-X9-DG protein/prepilin-type N-terminal cleavage/methylation domain-containing protein
LAVERKGEMSYRLAMANSRKSLAFTLTELLVVVAVIGILAALLATTVSGAKERAWQVQCANNLRQLGIGLQAFVADNSAYPLYSNPDYYHSAYPKYKAMWVTALQYTELSVPGNSTNHVLFHTWSGEGVWKCPAGNKPPDWPQNQGYEGYGYNAYGMSARTDTNSLGLGGHYVWNPPRVPAPPVSESEVVNPSEMMAIGDGFIGGNGIIKDGVWLFERTYDVTNYLGSTQRAYARHRSKANVVFCDGHVESPTLKFLFEDTSDAALVHWNRDHLPHREELSP